MATDRTRPKARLPRGFADRGGAEIRRVADMMETIRGVYGRWGYEPVETPLIEYADALGKFLPDQDRPNEGVFAFQDDDEQWLSLRYDLTAPLARMVAENYERLPKPYKSYRAGWVFRNEKPGPGRFRQFMQFDADIVGSGSPLADAEITMMSADTMEALGFARGEYRIRVNSREILDATMAAVGLAGEEFSATRLTVLRTIDKADKFPLDELMLLLTAGRQDESGDFTAGAGLSREQAQAILRMTVDSKMSGRPNVPDALLDDARYVNIYGAMLPIINSSTIIESRRALEAIGGDTACFDRIAALTDAIDAAKYGSRRINIDLSVVRGLEYYTGCVFEAELLFETTDAEGRPQKFGSVGGGGRYDGLVGRFRGENVPATGFSVGVSRLAAALAARDAGRVEHGPVVVTVMDRAEAPRYQALAQKLRAALGSPVEMYIGESGMKAQLKYADRRNAPCVVIQGSDERERGVVQIKDLALGKQAAENIDSREDWVAARPAQQEVRWDGEDVAAIVQAIKTIVG